MISAYLIFLSLIVFSCSADYCEQGLCPDGEPHIGCNNDGNFASSCPANAHLLPIDEEAQNAAVKAHNEARQRWANGDGVLSIPACRMATIQWDDELARLAELNVKQCVMEHDCHNTAKYKSSGQNLFTESSTGELGSVESILQQAVTDWESEGSNIKAEYLGNYPSDYQGPEIGHFTVVVNEINTALGCAVIQYVEADGFNTVIVACNYATTNIVGERVYESCSEPASGCRSQTNPEYSALCSASEQYN